MEKQYINLNDKSTIDKIWNDKFFINYYITSIENGYTALKSGIAITNHYPRVLTKNEIKKLVDSYVNQKESLILISIPSELHKKVWEISDREYEGIVSELDYDEDLDCFIEDESDTYTLPYVYMEVDKVANITPSPLIYGIITKDENNNTILYNNPNYYTNLSNKEKEFFNHIISDTVEEIIKYEDYMDLMKKYYNDDAVGEVMKSTHPTDIKIDNYYTLKLAK